MSRLLFIPAILISALASPGPWSAPLLAAERSADEADIGDGPVIRTHVDEADCESGRIALDVCCMLVRGPLNNARRVVL